MSKKSVILFALMNGTENIDSCQVLANYLQEKGYQIVMAFDKTSQAYMKTIDCQQEVINIEFPSKTLKNTNQNVFNGSPINVMKKFSHKLIVDSFAFVKQCEDFNILLVKRIKPDLIIIESMICSPALINSGIPWIWLNFCPPNICQNDSRLPPGWSGLTKTKPNEWKVFREERDVIFKELKQQITNWCALKGQFQELPLDTFHPQSPVLNVYVYPNELDSKLTLPWNMRNWMQVDCLIKESMVKKFEIPEKFHSKHDKLVFISMGPLAGAHIMTKLVTVLAESSHRYIVSKGPHNLHYDLPDNMYGVEYIQFDDVVHSVQLIITCGDTKTIVQSLYHGKPVIIMPLYGDQLDNRIRFKEIGFGWGLDPFDFNKETLFAMIDNLLYDRQLSRRLSLISKSMQTSNSCQMIADKINNILNVIKCKDNNNIDDNKNIVIKNKSIDIVAQVGQVGQIVA